MHLFIYLLFIIDTVQLTAVMIGKETAIDRFSLATNQPANGGGGASQPSHDNHMTHSLLCPR